MAVGEGSSLCNFHFLGEIGRKIITCKCGCPKELLELGRRRRYEVFATQGGKVNALSQDGVIALKDFEGVGILCS